ncbi:MAG: YbfB/YjiJ family MFS transporter [Candidimonas sp.]
MNPAALPWALSAATAVSVGFGRFGYTLILPAMQTDLGLSHVQSGWLGTANALGYLLGSILSLWLIPLLGNRRMLAIGLIVTTLALIATGLTHHFHWLSFHRFMAGVGGAGAFITGGVLAGSLGTRAIVVFFSGGGGLSMLATGALLPWFLDAAGPAAWPQAWLFVGAICIPLSLAAILAARALPDSSAPGTASASWPWRRCVPALISYVLYGLGYIAYMTFIITWLRTQPLEQLSYTAMSSLMWSLLSVMMVIAPLLWRRVFHGRRDGIPITLSTAVVAVGTLLPLVMPNLIGVCLSAALVGTSVFMVPSAVTGFIKTNLVPAAWSPALAVATCLFAVGQTIGPVAAGWISDVSGSLSAGLAASTVLLALASICGYLQKAVPDDAPAPAVAGQAKAEDK